jgi:hypothetical protein
MLRRSANPELARLRFCLVIKVVTTAKEVPADAGDRADKAIAETAPGKAEAD